MATLKCFEEILRVNLQNDRVIIPAIETIAGLLEENIFSRIESEYKFFPPLSISDQFPYPVCSHPEGWVQVKQCDETPCMCANVRTSTTLLISGIQHFCPSMCFVMRC